MFSAKANQRMSEAKDAAAQHRVLIDGRFLGKPGGFGRYIDEFCRAIGSYPQRGITFAAAVPKRPGEKNLPDYPNLTWHTLPNVNFMLWEQIMIPRLARRLKCHLIHFPNNTRAFFTGGLPAVTTVHDIIFLTQTVPNQDVRYRIINEYTKLIFRLATRRSAAIVSISNTTRACMNEIGLNSTTVYNTIDGFLAKAPPRGAKPAKPYILHRGGYLAHRNTGRVIKAFRLAQQTRPDIELKIVGIPDGAARLSTVGDGSIHYMPRLTDAEMAALYQESSCVVVVSLEEGFGLPIIEGFGFGSPVITSDLDPMREIAADAAILVDPFDVDAIAGAMIAVLSDPGMAESLVAKGQNRLAAFSSAQIAEKMIAIYQSCLAP